MTQLLTIKRIVIGNTRFDHGPLGERILGKMYMFNWSCIVWQPYDKLDERILGKMYMFNWSCIVWQPYDKLDELWIMSIPDSYSC